MPDLRIQIIVDPARAVSGAKSVRKELGAVEGAADQLRRTLNRAFTIAGIGLAVRQVVSYADAYVNLQNRIRTVVSSEQELIGVTADLLDVANRTRSSLEATTTVYTRLAVSAKQLGIDQAEVLGITESLNQAVILSGASAEEARAGLIQLSQGFASGALRGDELRSVLEQLPFVADVIAKSLGVTRGELRKLGEDGRITAGVIAGAFRESREEIAERFAKTVPTVGQAFTILRNQVLQYVGSVSQATGASNGLATAIVVLANNLETLVAVATTAGVAFAAIKFGPAIAGASTAATAFIKLRIAVAAGNAVILGSAAATKLQAAADVEAARAASVRTAATLAAVEAERSKALISVQSTETAFIQAAVDQQLAALRAQQVVQTNALTAAELRLTTATKAATIQARALALVKNPFVLYTAGAVALGFAINEVIDRIIEFEKQSLKATEAGEQFALTDFGKVGAEIVEVQKELARVQANIDRDVATKGFANPTALKAAERYRMELQKLRIQQDLVRNGAANATVKAEEQARALQDLAKSVDEVVAAIGRENELLALNSREREIQIELQKEIDNLQKKGGPQVSEAQRAEIKAALLRNQALRDQSDVLDRIQGPQQQFEADLRALATLQANGTITQQQFNDEVVRLAQTLDGVDLSKLDLSDIGLDPAAIAKLVDDLRASIGQFGGGKGFAEAFDLQAQVLADIEEPQKRFAATQEALNNLLAAGSISAEQYAISLNNLTLATNEVSTSLGQGFQAGLAQISNQILDVSGAVQVAMVNAFNAGTEALVEFATTGKANFSEAISSILKDLARLALQQALLSLFGSFLAPGAPAPGSAGFVGPPPPGGFQEGGRVRRRQTVVVGERGPELFTPESAGTITPAGETAALLRGASQPIVNVTTPPPQITINNVSDMNEIPAAIESPAGEQAVLNVIRRRGRTVRGSIS